MARHGMTTGKCGNWFEVRNTDNGEVVCDVVSGTTFSRTRANLAPSEARQLAAMLVEAADEAAADTMIEVPREVRLEGKPDFGCGVRMHVIVSHRSGRIVRWQTPIPAKTTRRERHGSRSSGWVDGSLCAAPPALRDDPSYLRAVALLTESPTEMVRRSEYEESA